MSEYTAAMIIGTIAGGLGMWIVAGIWHNFVMPKFYRDVHATHDGIGLLLVAYAILAAMMSYLYPYMSGDGGVIGAGLHVGVFVGMLWILPHGIAMVAAHDRTTTAYVLKNTAWHMVEQGIGGVIIAFVYHLAGH